jgi:16S rRNA (cytidine1402-2'-O)-methyltransferase
MNDMTDGSPTATSRGTLYLIPTNLTEPFRAEAILPAEVRAQALRLDHFIAENAKTARAFLKAIGIARPLAEISIVELDKHNAAGETEGKAALLTPLCDGHDVGLVSEAGAPAVADPGARVVAAAHKAGIRVVPMVGASSLLLGLMGSGLNGQCFAFHGYLPQEKSGRITAIQTLERESFARGMTQMLIETPYRNQPLMDDLLASLSAKTHLCVAADLTGANEMIETKPVSEWKRLSPKLAKVPTLFLFLASK